MRRCACAQRRSSAAVERDPAQRGFGSVRASARRVGPLLPVHPTTRLDTPDPVFGPLPARCHGVDEDATVSGLIDNGKGETFHQDSSRLSGRRNTGFRESQCTCRCGLDRQAEAASGSRPRRFVVANLVKQFLSRLRRKADSLHGARRRASAKTSSASNTSTSPRRYAATLRSISSRQATSISGEGGS